MKPIYLIFLIGFLIIVLGQSIFFNRPFHDLDEGAYVYVGQGWLEGKLPYVDAFQTKPPGIYAVNALAQLITPHRMVGLRFLGWIAIAFSLLLSFYFVRIYFSETKYLVGTGILLTLLFLHPGLESEATMTEIFALPFVLALIGWGYQAIQKNPSWKLTIGLGTIAGAGVLFSIYLIPFILFFCLLLWHLRKTKMIIPFVVGAALPIGLVGTYFIANGAGNGMVFSLITWAQRYSHRFFLSHEGLANASSGFFLLAPFILVAGWGMMQIRKRSGELFILLSGWMGINLLMLVMIGSVFPHHLMMTLPALAIAGGIFLGDKFPTKKTNGLDSRLPALAFAATVLILTISTLGVISNYAWSYDDPVYQAQGTIIQSVVAPGETIYVWGYNPEIYFYAQRRAPTPYFDSMSLIFVDAWRPIESRDKEHVTADFAKNPPEAMIISDYDLLLNPEVQEFLRPYDLSTQYPWLYLLHKPRIQ